MKPIRCMDVPKIAFEYFNMTLMVILLVLVLFIHFYRVYIQIWYLLLVCIVIHT